MATEDDERTAQETPGEREPSGPRLSQLARRGLSAAALVFLCALAFGVALTRFEVSDAPREIDLGAAANEAVARVYVQPVAIDPVNDSIEFRFNVLPGGSRDGSATADRNLLLIIEHDKQIDTILSQANQPFPEATFAVDLQDGSVRDYPFDTYRVVMRLSYGEPGQARLSLPLQITTWEGLLGFQVRAEPFEGRKDGVVPLAFTIRRSGATAFFGMALYGAMAVMALCALTIGMLLYMGVRKIEATFVGALGAMVFALPALRNALPGTPPLGVRADIIIFFWAELAVIVALCMFVVAWTRRGTPP
jgi:Domain of unknown function (DUF4436)